MRSLGDEDTTPGWRKLFQLSQLAHKLIICAAYVARTWNHWLCLCTSICTLVRITVAAVSELLHQCVSKADDPSTEAAGHYCGWVTWRKLPAEQTPPASDDSTTRPIKSGITIAAKGCDFSEGRVLTKDTALATMPFETEVSFDSAKNVNTSMDVSLSARLGNSDGDDHHADEASSSNSVIPATSDVESRKESEVERSKEQPELPSRPHGSLRSHSSRLALLRNRAKQSSAARGVDDSSPAENCKLQSDTSSSDDDARHRAQEDGIGIEQPQLIAVPSSAQVQNLSVVAARSTRKKPPVKSRPSMAQLTASTFGLDLSSLEILVVEDDGIQQVVVAKFLESHGLKAVCVDCGEDALSLLEERKRNGGQDTFPGIILMDLMMPGLDGHETTEKIRTLYPTAALPIIMLTSDESEETVVEALRRGANDILTKIHLKGCLIARIVAQLSTLRFWRSRLDAQKNEQLLKEILPDSVIQRLSQGPRLICDEHDEVSIVFTDIVGFTDLASSIPTRDLIDMLDKLFNTFDTLSDKHGVYKVETIGDAYMVVAGHELSSQGDHAIRAVQMAADMVEAASCMTMPNGKPLKIRAGVHSGPAFSGVVGWKRPRFCMFGDTVNVASRMESTSFSCCVQVSTGTREYHRAQEKKMPDTVAKEIMDFKCLGPRDIKGKGNMTTFLAKVGDWEEAVKDLDS